MDLVTEFSDQIATEGTTDYSELHDVYLAEAKGINTNQIVAALASDENKHPHDFITTAIAQDPQTKVQITINGELAEASLINRINQPISSIFMSSKPKAQSGLLMCEQIKEGTFNRIKDLEVKTGEANARVNEKIKTAI